METSTLVVLALGFFLGLKHAVEADHIAAVSTIVSERKSLWGSALIGGIWGLGHTISLAGAGFLVLLLNFEISEKTERVLEIGVGVMLLFLGLNVFRRIARGGKLHFHSHGHGAGKHVHPHIHELETLDEKDSHHGLKFSPRALLIGMVHGLAGSAAVMILVVPTIDSRPVGILYIVIFGIGSIGGMMLMSFLVGLPFHLTGSRFKRFDNFLQGGAGLVSVVVGLTIIYGKAFTAGLFA
jgi:sulfite exporter TauE/SafE